MWFFFPFSPTWMSSVTQYRDYRAEINKITSSLHPNKRYRTKKERITILQKLSIYIAEKAMWVFFFWGLSLRRVFFFFFPQTWLRGKNILQSRNVFGAAAGREISNHARLHLALLRAASFASVASLQLEVNTCQTDWRLPRRVWRCRRVFRVCVCVCVRERERKCVCVCVSDLGSGPGTWPRCVPASDRTPPSPGRGCHRNGHPRHTPGWSWCGSSRCCKHTCGGTNHIRGFLFIRRVKT